MSSKDVSLSCGGYTCEFIEKVFGDYYCNKCGLVARRLCVASCCGEHYCHSCISTDINQHRPCPECGTDSFNIVELVKLQRRVANLSAYCSMKERGCKWSGTLEAFDTHIDPHLNNCQYIDASCPLNCQQAVPRYELDDHVTKECIKRNYSCQFCSFNATYQEIVDIHLPKCSYVPLQCPNMCGVSCEREMMEDHMKTCRLERVACQFSAMGCREEFKREDQEAHINENAQTHLLLTATTLNQKLLNQECTMQQELEDQQRNTKTEFKQLSQMIAKQAHQLQDYKKKLEEGKRKHEQELATYKKKLNDQDHKYKSKFEEYEVKLKCQDEKLKKLEKFINSSRANGGGKSDGRIGGGATSGGGAVASTVCGPVGLGGIFKPLRCTLDKLCKYPGCSYYCYEDLNRYCPDCYETVYNRVIDRDQYPLV